MTPEDGTRDRHLGPYSDGLQLPANESGSFGTIEGELKLYFIEKSTDIYFINHYLSASLLQPGGVKRDMCDRLSHINE